MYSEAFDVSLKLKVTTYVLRCIDRHGGIDNYLTKTSDEKLASKLGSELKMQVIEQKRRLAAGEPPLPPPKQVKRGTTWGLRVYKDPYQQLRAAKQVAAGKLPESAKQPQPAKLVEAGHL